MAVAAALIVMLVPLAMVAMVAPAGMPGPLMPCPTTRPAVLGRVTVVVALVEAPVRFTEGVRPLKRTLELMVLVPLMMRAPISLTFMLRTLSVPPEMLAVVVTPKTLAVPVIAVAEVMLAMVADVAPEKVLVSGLAPVEVTKPITGS